MNDPGKYEFDFIIYNCRGLENSWQYVHTLISTCKIGFFYENWMSKWKKELVLKIKMMDKDIFVTSAVKSNGKRGRNAMGQFWTIPKSWRPFCKFDEFSKRTSALIIKTKSFRYIFIGTYLYPLLNNSWPKLKLIIKRNSQKRSPIVTLQFSTRII